MAKKRYVLQLVLMASSLLLLLVFQGFWLNKVYRDEFFVLRREADHLFRTTMYTLQDSLVQQHMRPYKAGADSAAIAIPLMVPPIIPHADSINQWLGKMVEKSRDSAAVQTQQNSRIKVEIRRQQGGSDAQADTTAAAMMSTFVMNAPGDKNDTFILRFNHDSVRVGEIASKYGQALAKADIHLPFEIRRFSNYQRMARRGRSYFNYDSIPHEGFATAKFYFFPTSAAYEAYFTTYTPFVWGKMLMPVLFSVFLLAITSAAFFLIFRSLKQQQRLTELKNDFISNVTHELKTPVSTVSVAIEALSNFNALQNPALTKEYLQISKHELQRLGMLIDQIMKMAMFEKKGIELQQKTLDFRHLVTGIINSMKLQFEKHGATVLFDAQGSHFEVQGDEIHLTNVVYNLLDNALKYSPVNPQIDVRLQQQGGSILLSVADRGMGIAPEHRDKIFEKFYRVPTGNLHAIKGYGLGLSYVASVVAQHGGHIEVQSQVGQGSTFTIKLVALHAA